MRKGILVILLLVFSLGSCIGAKTVTPEVDIVRVTKTKTVTVTEPAKPAVTEYVMPESCISALRYAGIMARASERIYSRGRAQLNIISDVRSSLAAGTNTSDESDRQRDLMGTTVAALSDLEEASYQYDVALKECKKESQ